MNNSNFQKKFYDYEFKTVASSKMTETIREFYFQKIISILDPIISSPKKFLEIGCGEGILMGKMSKHYKDSSFQGIDISEKNVELTKKRDLDAHVDDAQDIKLDEKFDVIYGSAFLHHLDNMEACINSVSRHLNKNGVILFGPEPVFYQFLYIIWHKIRGIWEIEKGMMNISENKIRTILGKDFENISIQRHGNAFVYAFSFTGKLWNFSRLSTILSLNDIYIFAKKK